MSFVNVWWLCGHIFQSCFPSIEVYINRLQGGIIEFINRVDLSLFPNKIMVTCQTAKIQMKNAVSYAAFHWSLH